MIANDVADPTKANTNYGLVPKLTVGFVGIEVRRALLRFHPAAAGVPSDATVTSATLTVRMAQSLGKNPVDVYAGTSLWSESTVTWNEIAAAPGGGVGALAATFATLGVPNNSSIAVPLPPALAQSWLDPSTNYGLLLDHPAAGRTTMGSAEAPSLSRPTMQLCYDVPSCIDGVQNQGETGIDCGGPCAPCATCNDGIQNQGESGIDCSGPCDPCVGGVHVWSRGLGSSNTATGFGVWESVTAVATDAAGNVYATGSINGTTDFGGGPINIAGGDDVFVVKYDAAGGFVWARVFGTWTNEYALGIAVGEAGDVHVTGRFAGTVSFGGPALTALGFEDIFVVKLDTNGAFVWSQRFGLGPQTSNEGRTIALDGAGNVFVGGVEHTSGFVAMLSPAGVTLWTKLVAGTTVYVNGVASTPSGDVVACGQYRGAVDFGGGPLPSAGAYANAFVVRLSGVGAQVWAHAYASGTGHVGGGAVTVDSLGDVVAAGTFSGTVDFGGGPQLGSPSSYLLKLDGAGAFLWNQVFFAQGGMGIRAVATDSQRNVLFGGYLWTATDFGGGPVGPTAAQNRSDAFLVKDTPAGDHLWSRAYSGPQAASTGGICAAPGDDVVFGGVFSTGIDFGGGTIACQGTSDGFVARLSP
jgi:hypothetical protein